MIFHNIAALQNDLQQLEEIKLDSIMVSGAGILNIGVTLSERLLMDGFLLVRFH